jgi:hypothetical protein
MYEASLEGTAWSGKILRPMLRSRERIGAEPTGGSGARGCPIWHNFLYIAPVGSFEGNFSEFFSIQTGIQSDVSDLICRGTPEDERNLNCVCFFPL